MNFTSDIKKEIIHHGLHTVEERIAALSAFVRTSGFVGKKDGVPSFFIVSETENVAEFFMAAFAETFKTDLAITHATMDRMSGRGKLLLQCPPAYIEEVLKTEIAKKVKKSVVTIENTPPTKKEVELWNLDGAQRRNTLTREIITLNALWRFQLLNLWSNKRFIPITFFDILIS
jgi:DNA-binding transcriptional regulator WhiA